MRWVALASAALLRYCGARSGLGAMPLGWMIWVGAVLSLSGVGGLLWCIVLALKARRAGLSDDAMRARLQHIVTLNMAALGVSALGLMAVVAGILLG